MTFRRLNVLVACEFSAVVRDAFLDRGHDAYSVDLDPTEGDPIRHTVMDAVEAANHHRWDLVIAFPPCTYLTKAGARYWPQWRESGQQAAAVKFVDALWNANADRVAIENPAGFLTKNWRRPDQIIDPFQFGDPYKKGTCLWLNNLPRLVSTYTVEPKAAWVDGGATTIATHKSGKRRNSKDRSRTFAGIAAAMAEQWGSLERQQ